MAEKSFWREKSAQVIKQVISQNPGLSTEELRKKISDAYPFGLRQNHPYQIWLDEVKIQLGTKEPRQPGKPKPVNNPDQTTLF